MQPELETREEPSMSDRPSQPAGPKTPGASDRSPHAVEPTTPDGELLEEDLLVEDVSIDGMCGVY